MKRNRFIGALALLAVSPFSAFSRLKKSVSEKKGFKISAGEGRIHGHIKLKGLNSNIMDVKISGSDTDGALAIFENTSLTQGRGTPLHIHHFQDEIFYVIEGEFYFQVGEEKYKLKSGETIFLPRKVPHAWTQISEKGKMNVIFQPAGKLEDFFVSLSNFDHEPSKEEMAKLFTDNEMQIVGPPLKLE